MLLRFRMLCASWRERPKKGDPPAMLKPPAQAPHGAANIQEAG